MGFLDSLLGILGFGIGISIGIIVGFFLFIYFELRDVKVPDTKQLDDFYTSSPIDLFPKLPLWVMNPDYERVDWLNKFLVDMWPYFDKGASGIIKSSAEAIFSEYIGSYQIKSITFDHFTLGNIPPTIHGLKAQESKEDQLVIDLPLRWAGNGNIVLAFKLLSLEFNIQLVDLQISATSRIFLRPLVLTFPCFSSIAVSLMEKPQIDFGLRVLGGDIMAIPGLYQFIQEIVSRQVAKLYLWPQTYELDILDSSIGAAKKPVGILHVKIVRAYNLLNKDFFTTSDPYVKLSFTGERLPSKKTSIKMNNLNPEWNEEFKITVKDPVSQVLQLQLYDWEKVGAHDYLGMQTVPLNQLIPYEKKEFLLDLLNSTDSTDPENKKPRGQIAFEMSFVPFFEDSKSLNYAGDMNLHSARGTTLLCGSGLLLVTVISAKGVEGKKHNNPCVIVIFRGDQKKTKCIKKTRHPYWNEEFEFVLEEAPVKEKIHIEVVSKKRRIGFSTKEVLGHVDISLSDIVYNLHINEKYHLINSRYGIIHLDIRWKVI